MCIDEKAISIWSDKHKRAYRAFSVVELLVTISVISLLLAILVPALGRARDQSKIITCRSNLRSITLACLAYANQNNGFLPADANLCNPHSKLLKALQDSQYTSLSVVYYCPSEKRDDLRWSKENFAQGNIGYFYYSFTDRPTNRYLSNYLLKSVPWPRLLRTTMNGDVWVVSDAWFGSIPTAHRWYQKGVNYAVLDGSVNMVKESPRSKFK
ncbi:MAG: type II secretion system protein [Sedimentisphaerales bacterium]|nr:type II secretion system protein [Sedimentisphaerales bacterium]